MVLEKQVQSSGKVEHGHPAKIYCDLFCTRICINVFLNVLNSLLNTTKSKN